MTARAELQAIVDRTDAKTIVVSADVFRRYEDELLRARGHVWKHRIDDDEWFKDRRIVKADA